MSAWLRLKIEVCGYEGWEEVFCVEATDFEFKEIEVENQTLTTEKIIEILKRIENYLEENERGDE